jgi:hypothetical protein
VRVNAAHGEFGEFFVDGVARPPDLEGADSHDQRCDDRSVPHAIVMSLFR